MSVAAQAEHIRINHDRIPSYVASLPPDRAQSPGPDPQCHYLGHGDDTVAFLLTLNSINFGSGYFPYLRKRPGMSGYFTIATSLNDYYREHGPLSAQELSELCAKDCAHIFGQNLSIEPVQELMDLFSRALNDLGKYLLEEFSGLFTDLVRSCNHSAEHLVGLLSAMPFFRDTEHYKGFDVPFYKRAQITAADLALAFGKRGMGRFDDLHRLTMFADNLVPHVLRTDGILLYDDELAVRIDSGELIPAGSPEEVEIRACAVHAVELMVNALRSAGKRVTSPELDHILWNRGQEPYYKQIKPRHRTRTVLY